MFPSKLLSLAALCASLQGVAGTGTYSLIKQYTPANFFRGFTFFNGSDPTNGFVT